MPRTVLALSQRERVSKEAIDGRPGRFSVHGTRRRSTRAIASVTRAGAVDAGRGAPRWAVLIVMQRRFVKGLVETEK